MVETLWARCENERKKHIQAAPCEELDFSTVANFTTVQCEGSRHVVRQVEYYNLDMIAESKPEEKETMVKLVMNFLAGS